MARLALLALVLAGPAGAQMLDGIPPQHRIVLVSFTGARYNPLGLATDLRGTYRLRLYPSDQLALQDNFFAAGATLSVSPAIARVGALVELQPLTILKLWALYEEVQFYGNFSEMQSFPSARADYSDSTLTALGNLPSGDPRRNYGGHGGELSLGARLQLKFGNVALVDGLVFDRHDYALRAGDRLLYDPVLDILSPGQGWTVADDADLVYFAGEHLIVGARWSFASAFYRSEDFAPGESQANLNRQQRLGPLAAWTFFKHDDRRRFWSPTMFAVAGWYLEHRFRTGADTSGAIPYLAAGFGFWSDLLPATER